MMMNQLQCTVKAYEICRLAVEHFLYLQRTLLELGDTLFKVVCFSA